MKFEITKESNVEKTFRVLSLGSMFDVPIEDKLTTKLSGTLPLEERSWNIGLIVGPSGSGKTLILEDQFGHSKKLEWTSRSVIDDFPSSKSMESISQACSSVGFNTIPAWLRPFAVLSNGERFRAEIARLLLDDSSTIICDEFSSVVDRQVAQITSHAVQKYVRENNRRFVAASCHYDIIDWLQPDWILEPGDPSKFTWRSLQPRPQLTVRISRVKYEAWELFKNYHYMTPELNHAAKCFGLFVSELSSQDVFRSSNESVKMPELPKLHVSRHLPSISINQPVVPSTRSRIACFLGTLHRPHPKVRDIIGVSRVVTLPDWQGLGLAFALIETVAAAYKALGKRFHNYPNHPAFVRSHQRSRNWMQIKTEGTFSPSRGSSSTVRGFGSKKCAVFMFTGSPMNKSDAEALINGTGQD